MTVTATRTPVTLPALLLRLEGLAVFAGAISLYANRGGSGLLFLVLLLVPDLAALGYLANTRVGAITYSAVHTGALPAVLMAFALSSGEPIVVNLALIWFAD